MKLIGMLDSPFVRRTAIGLSGLGLTFEHQSLSVFSDVDRFRTLNPLVKAPTLLLDNGTLLMDSSLILQYAERLSERTMNAGNPEIFARQQQITGTALIACEKTVQIVYEHQLRPEQKRHQPWLDRVEAQLQQAFEQLELAVTEYPALFSTASLSHASVASAVAWYFTRQMRPEQLVGQSFPALTEWSLLCEQVPEFQTFPYDNAMSDGEPWSHT